MADPELLSNLRDFELFLLMSNRKIHPDLAKQAWAILFERYFPYVESYCKKLIREQYTCEDIATDSLINAFVSSHTYKGKQGIDSKSEFNYTLNWLNKIAQNIFRDKIKSVIDNQDEEKLLQKDLQSRFIDRTSNYDINSLHNPYGTTDARSMLNEKIIVEEALASLSTRSADILLRSIEFIDRESGVFSPPRKVITEICNDYGITKKNYRQIRHRAWRKLESLISAKLNEAQEGINKYVNSNY